MMVYSIGYLRGLAALLVVLFHYRDYLNDVYVQKDLGTLLFGSGSVGVDIFFVISGFIIVYSTRKKEANGTLKFAIRRFFRIYPLLIFSVIFFSWVTPEIFSLKEMVRAIIPLTRDFSEPAPYFGFNVYVPAWTLMYEVFFYFIFLISMSICHKYRVLISSLAIVLMVFGLQKIFSGHISLDAHNEVKGIPNYSGYGLIHVLSSPMILEFVFGMLLACAYDKPLLRGSELTRNASSFYLWVCVGIFLTFWFSFYRAGVGPVNYGLWALIILPASLFYEKFNDIKPNKILIFLGDISYSLYMVHIIIPFFIGYKASWDPIYLGLSGFAKLFYILTLSISVAYIIHISIEKPMIKLSRNIINKI